MAILISDLIKLLGDMKEEKGDILINIKISDVKDKKPSKTCTVCKQVLDTKYFHKNRPECKFCSAKRLAKNREKYRKIHTDQWYEDQVKNNLKLKCKTCGEMKDCHEFTINRIGKIGFNIYCKDCRPIGGVRETKLKDLIK